MATKVAIEVDVKTGDASDDIIALREELEKIKETQAKLEDQFKAGFEAAEKGAKGASKGMKGFGGSIGGVLKSLGLIAIAMQVFMFLKDLLMKNQKVMDALSTATVAFEIIMNKVMDAVMGLAKPMQAAFSDPKQAVLDLWEAIKTNFVNRLEGVILAVEAAGKAIEAAFNFDWDAASDAALDFGSALIQVGTGLDAEQQKAFVEGVVDFAKEVATATVAAVAQADALVRLRNEVALLEASQQKIQLGFQREAELQRQARDDIRLTIAERIAANDKLGEILKEQAKTEEERVNKTLLLRQLELKQLGENTERLAAVAVAEGAVAELRERIVSQESEQLTNQAALEKELFDLKLELAKVGKEQRELELLELEQHYAALEEKARLAGDTTTNIEGAKQEALAKLRKKFRDEDLAKEKKLRDDKIKLQQDYLSATGSILGAIDQLVAASGKNSKQALVLQKTLAVAQIAIDTAKAIVGAIAQAQSVPYPGNLVAIATGVAAVIAGIASAVTTLNSADVGGGNAPPPSPPPTVTAPAMQQATAGTTELGGVGQAQLAPIQAYVVETEVTGNQNNVNQIESQATFGG
jgi:hypothetical protein